MHKPLVFMFSGQGSQTYQMGRELIRENALFRDWMQEADRLVRHWLSVSILDEIYDEHRQIADPFTRTIVTHPAIFAVQYGMTRLLESWDIRPDLLIGASLGEFGAAAVAGVIGFEQAMELVCLQAQILETHCPNSGGMLAVLAPVRLYESAPWIRDTTTLAAVNTQEHFVLAGTRARLRSVERRLVDTGTLCQALPVTHAFHSPIIDSLAPIYLPVLERQVYRAPARPLVLCSNPGPIEAVGATDLWSSIRAPIRLRETLLWMETRGDFTYIDVGPSGTMATFAKHNLSPTSGSSTHTTLTPFGRDLQQLQRLREALSASGR